MKHVILFIIALLAVGCGSTSGVNLPVSPAQAQTTTDSVTRRTLLATFDDGRQVGINLLQSTNFVTGRAVSKDGGDLVVYEVGGNVSDQRFRLQLYPAENFGDYEMLLVEGNLGGDGTWQDLNDTNSGTIALTESLVNGQQLGAPLINGSFTAMGTFTGTEPNQSAVFNILIEGGQDSDPRKYSVYGTYTDEIGGLERGNVAGDAYANGAVVLQLDLPQASQESGVWRAILAYDFSQSVVGSSVPLNPSSSMINPPGENSGLVPFTGEITFNGQQ